MCSTLDLFNFQLCELELMKVCSKCGGEPQPLDNFNKKSDSKDGRRSECRICSSIDHSIRKKAGKIKTGSSGKWEKDFKEKYGVPFGTIRDWLKREYCNKATKYWLWGEIPLNERQSYIDKYKRWKGDKIK